MCDDLKAEGRATSAQFHCMLAVPALVWHEGFH